ncbi:COL12A1 [Branchiostoma lanceolatum]|uniref:COL12A1 protein n=1 Tax=Branchiostoma lanceolatum TaxID=7740 RepID=A0A8K0AEC8_BRALA|nr:COL12A1 [Branchiostoma lanceolatum]
MLYHEATIFITYDETHNQTIVLLQTKLVTADGDYCLLYVKTHQETVSLSPACLQRASCRSAVVRRGLGDTESDFVSTWAAVGLWPLNARYGASDITGNGNYGTVSGTQLAPGPFGDADGSFQFSGTADSYIAIPNNGMLDVRYSYTILAHIFPTGDIGPIFDYAGNNGQWAVNFWQLSPQTLQSRPVRRDGTFPPDVTANVLQQNAWNYVGGRYDSTTGMASIWKDGALVVDRQIGVAEVATQYPIRVAVRAGDNRYYAGRIACLQLYNYAMTQAQIAAARYVCNRGARACKSEILSIQCPAGQRINIVSALFGRTSRQLCPGIIHTTNCSSPNGLAVVRSSCHGKSSCSVLAHSSVFGDPCFGTDKYLEVEFNCILSACPSPPTFDCTTVSGCSAPYIDGETCTYNCNDTCGGSPSTMTRTCRRGLWYGEAWRGCFPRGCQTAPPSPSSCIEVICSSGAPYNNGDRCEFRCAPNCTGSIITSKTCNNGHWDGGLLPRCVPETSVCRSPPSFDCTTISDCIAPYIDGDTCTYRCDDGCTGSPSTMTRTCIRGRWYGLPWKGCRENCEAPPTFPCSVRSGCDSPYTSGETCTYQCDMYRGCTGSPLSTTRTCNDGDWVGPRWRGCHARKCGSPPTKRWASYTCDEPGSPYPSGTTCTYRCRPGCNARPATSTEICYNGRWYTRRKWKCKKRCGEPPSPPCTKRFGCAPSYTYGESCSYRCYNKGGYAMEVSGDAIRTCQKDGTWSGTDLVCECKDRKDCCRPDIIFVLDYSGSISDSEFQQMKDFVYELVRRFDIGPLDAQVGVLRYNWNPIAPVIQLDTYDNKADLLNAIDDLPTTTGGGTRTGVALTYVATTMLSTGNRPDAPDVVIVLTDGFSADSVTGPALLLHGMGVQTFAIGVGSCVNDANLHEIANCRDHVYKLADFRGLERHGITYIIHRQICCDKLQPKVTCPENYVSFKGTCLRFSQPHDQQGFEQAQRTCRAEGSRLVVIKSATLDAFIDNQIKSIPLDNTWIGLSTTFPAIPDEWTDGSTLVAGDYSDWEPYQTDMAPGEFCADIRPGYGYTWNTDNCKVHKNYICEHVAAPCCPRPRTGVSDPGYTLSDDRTYSLSPPLNCDAPAEETLPPPDDHEYM